MGELEGKQMLCSQRPPSRKGPLGAVLVAAYCEKRLSKGQVVETDIPSSVDKILIDEWPYVTYRILAYLLLGVVRIFSKKVEYVFDDCNKIINLLNSYLGKKRTLLSKDLVRLPKFSITLPERYELDAFILEVSEDMNRRLVAGREDDVLKAESLQREGGSKFSLDEHNPPEAVQQSPGQQEGTVSSSRISLKVAELVTCSTSYASPDRLFSPEHMEADVDPSSPEFMRIVEGSFEELGEMRFSQEECLDCEEFFARNIAELCDIYSASNIKASASVEQVDSFEELAVLDHDRTAEKDKKLTVELEMLSENHDTEVIKDKEVCFTVKGTPETSPPCADLEMSSHDHDHIAGKDEVRDQRCVDLEMPSENHAMETVNDKELCFNVKGTPETGAPCADLEMSILDGDHIAENDEEVTVQRCVDLEMPSENHDTEAIKNKEVCFTIKRTPKTIPSCVLVAITPELKIPNVEGSSTIEQLAVRTPAHKESTPKARKCRCIYDDNMKISNKTFKCCLDDASDIVRKRRKVAHTTLDVWRSCWIPSFWQNIQTPLIPWTVTELEEITRKWNSMEADQFNVVECFDEPGTAALSSAATVDIQPIAPGTPAPCSSSARVFESPQVPIAPGTPAPCSSSARVFESPRVVDSDGEGTNSLENAARVPFSPSALVFEGPQVVDSDAEDTDSFKNVEREVSMHEEVVLPPLMDQGEDPSDEDTLESSGWSTRTRTTATWLHRFMVKKSNNRKDGPVSLETILAGKMKEESARFFYEMLVLKSGGFVDVKQEEPYSDILLQGTPKMEATLGKC